MWVAILILCRTLSFCHSASEPATACSRAAVKPHT